MSLQRTGLPFGGFAVPYLEVAKVCAPNTAAQAISANTISVPSIDTTTANDSSLGVTVASDQIQNLPLGIYYCKIEVPYFTATGMNGSSLRLYNITDSVYLPVNGGAITSGNALVSRLIADGQFKITAAKTVTIRMICPRAGVIRNGDQDMTDSTASADVRSIIKLWKVG